MRPFEWSLAGLALDILGAFLLSAEAIKLENLSLIRHRLNSFTETRLMTACAIVALSALVSLVALTYFQARGTIPDHLQPAELIVFLAMFATDSVPKVVLLFAIAPTVIIVALVALVDLLGWVLNATPGGTPGIIGFGLLFLGFVGQTVGTWLGAVR